MLELENEYAKESSNRKQNSHRILISSVAFSNDNDDEEEGIKAIPDDDDDKNISRSTLRREAALVIEMIARKFEKDAFYKCQAKLEECLKNENWLIKYIN